MDKKCKVMTALVVIFLCLYYADGINALVKNEKKSLEFRADKLYLSQELINLEHVINQLPNSNAWHYFLQEEKEGFAYIDKRSGRPAALTFSFRLSRAQVKIITSHYPIYHKN